MHHTHFYTSTLLLLSAIIICKGLPVLLDFEGIGNYADIRGFYSGRNSSLQTSGTDFGINFTAGISIEDRAKDSSSFLIFSPTFVGTSDRSHVDVERGFSAFSFTFSSPSNFSLRFFDDFNATGEIFRLVHPFIRFL
eukprot:TRINITY_DN5787_c0_g1_i3.p1 TRINITY_DN5787_c0_g1~~TRINITY_DN5787_c0_g1_i3.p1  ORF type:complete len:137 (-),score=39.04 TRINITY_DN5787_c0_g1_i3:1168-1578(-)